MSQSEPPNVQIDVSNAASNQHLLLMVTKDSQCVHHQLTLEQARTISLEIIKKVYLAELNNSRKNTESVSQVAFLSKLQKQPKKKGKSS